MYWTEWKKSDREIVKSKLLHAMFLEVTDQLVTETFFLSWHESRLNHNLQVKNISVMVTVGLCIGGCWQWTAATQFEVAQSLLLSLTFCNTCRTGSSIVFQWWSVRQLLCPVTRVLETCQSLATLWWSMFLQRVRRQQSVLCVSSLKTAWLPWARRVCELTTLSLDTHCLLLLAWYFRHITITRCTEQLFVCSMDMWQQRPHPRNAFHDCWVTVSLKPIGMWEGLSFCGPHVFNTWCFSVNGLVRWGECRRHTVPFCLGMMHLHIPALACPSWSTMFM